MIIYSDNQTDIANVSASPSSVNYPPSNVKNSLLSKIYKGDEQIDFDISGSGSLKNISQAYTNLVQDPTDLTTGNWTLGNGATAVSSDETFQGLPMTKIGSTTSTGDPIIQQSVTVSSSVNHSASIVIRADGSDHATSQIFLSISGSSVDVGINWSSKLVTLNAGNSLKYTFVDNLTVELFLTSDALSSDTSIQLRIDPQFTGDSTRFLYVTACQVVDNTTTAYPFIDGSKSADVIDETFTMPDRFTFDMIVEPRFAYDTTSPNQQLLSWKFSATQRLQFWYEESQDFYFLVWEDGGSATMNTQKFDDGSSFTNLNQRIRFTGSMDLISGSISGSRLITSPLESGSLNEDSTWNSSPDIKTTDFPTLSIGHRDSTEQANASYEYLRIYEGLLVGDVTSSDDVTELLKDKKVLFDKTYQQKLTATDILIANSTINDGDTITLRANDVDSYGAGTPLDETITWSKDITKHNFALSSYQFWRLSVNSSNVISIGRIYLGENYQLPEILPTVEHQFVDPSIKTRTASSETYGDIRDPYTILDVNYPIVPYAQKTELMEIFREIGSYTPVFFKFGEIGIDIPSIYGTINQASISASMLDDGLNYSIGFSIIEEL